MRLSLASFVLALALCSGAQAATLAQSSFDNGDEGWTAINRVAGQGWVPTGGQASGYFSVDDAGEGMVWLYQAPTAYLGNQLAALGGTLSFALRTSTLESPMQSWGDVKFAGGGIELVIDAGASPGLDWTNYSVALAPGAWHVGDLNGALATQADFQTVLSNVSFLRIRGEFSTVLDRGGLDSVVLTSAVPEPANGLLLLTGLAGVAALLRRRG